MGLINLGEEIKKLRAECDQYKAERDTLIDDIAVLKANNERYKKRAENAMDYAERSQCEVLRLKQENKDLRLQADTYFDEWQESKLKAQAFDEIREIEKTLDITGYHEDAESYMYEVEHVIENYDMEDKQND